MQHSPYTYLALLLACTGCSADATTGADARITIVADARGSGRVDARGIRPDANLGQPDAMVPCEGADTEPNDTLLEATSQGTISDCDEEGGTAAGSTIAGNEDWFTFDATDNTSDFCSINPTVTFTGNVQLCLYFACNEGNVELTCPGGTTTAISGPAGCCGTSGFEITEYNCAGTTSEASRVHMQVSATSDQICEEYTIAYNF